MKACVLIPSYNEERTIGGIVKKLKAMGLAVLVIDDGSRDATERVAAENGAVVVRRSKNLGKGAALRGGFKYITRTTDFDTVVVMDGDGQHNPSDIEKFIEHARKHNDDVVIGNRMRVTKNMPFVRIATNKFMSLLISVMCKQDIPDTQCGFRLIRRRVLEKIKFDSRKYDFESEFLIKTARNNFKIASVPIETIYEGQPSRIHPIKDSIRFIGLLAKSYFSDR